MMINKWLRAHWWLNESLKIIAGGFFAYIAYWLYHQSDPAAIWISGIMTVAASVPWIDSVTVIVRKVLGKPIYMARFLLDGVFGPKRPKIVCLCGSTRFVDTFNEWRKKLTYEGCIVLSIEIVTTQSKKDDPQFVNSDLKVMLDELHLRKIDLADEVQILNVGGYIGESTRKEIQYAMSVGKPIKYLEQTS